MMFIAALTLLILLQLIAIERVLDQILKALVSKREGGMS